MNQSKVWLILYFIHHTQLWSVSSWEGSGDTLFWRSANFPIPKHVSVGTWGKRYLEASRQKLYLCTRGTILYCILISDVRPVCKLLMSKRADKREGRSVGPSRIPPPSASNKKALIIIFQSRHIGLHPLTDCANGKKCSRRGTQLSPPFSCSHSVSWHLQSRVSFCRKGEGLFDENMGSKVRRFQSYFHLYCCDNQVWLAAAWTFCQRQEANSGQFWIFLVAFGYIFRKYLPY